ncbi:hypothetical protein [Desulfospira joergensenii]|uniref:hypothetical protein n=1 Tax=Desulfospira joergensenii TaxID=53329 RepID=UPI0003B4223B|nr:hypothetical protein [Desulfospira joergensenii]
MGFTITRNLQVKAMLFLWVYDLIKFWLFSDLARVHGINPWIFLFLDMVTVVPYAMGLARFINSLTGQAQKLHEVLVWGIVLIFSTILPYAYAAWAGKEEFTFRSWTVFGLVLFFILVNLIRAVQAKLDKKKDSCAAAVQVKG